METAVFGHKLNDARMTKFSYCQNVDNMSIYCHNETTHEPGIYLCVWFDVQLSARGAGIAELDFVSGSNCTRVAWIN